VQSLLQRSQFPNESGVIAVADGIEILGIKLGKKRITIVQGWIMRADAGFENLTTITYGFESLARRLAATVVAAQIAQCLFAFKYRCRPNLLRDRPIAGHVGAISTSGQSDFHRARGKSVRLRPNKRELLEPGVLCCFAVVTCYSRSHVASSRAQYVTIMSAPALLSAVMISRTAARSSKIPFSAAALTMAYSPLT